MNHAMQIIQSPESRSIIKVSVETLQRHRAVASHWQWPHPNRRQPMQDHRWDRRPTYKLSPEAGVNHEAENLQQSLTLMQVVGLRSMACPSYVHVMEMLWRQVLYICCSLIFWFFITSTNPSIASAIPIWSARRRPTFPPTNKMCLRSHIQ